MSQRVNRVIDYIGGHLEEDLSLARLSGIACFSPFHFHRLFQGVTGETLHQYVRRVRLERAALLLRTFPEKRITDVALETGFAGTAEFSRAFKAHFERTASSWDRRSPLEKSKICKEPQLRPFHTEEELRRWKAEDAKGVRVRVRRWQPFRYVYLRDYDPRQIVESYGRLCQWLGGQRATFIGMSMDDPSITPPEKCRYDIGPAYFGGEEVPDCEGLGFSQREFPALDVAMLHCVGDIGHVDRAWHYLYRIWLPESGYEPANQPAMEMFLKTPEEIGWETYDLEACIPVVRP